MGRKLLLEHVNVPGINTIDVYRQNGGYAAVEKALKTLAPEAIVEEVKNRPVYIVDETINVNKK